MKRHLWLCLLLPLLCGPARGSGAPHPSSPPIYNPANGHWYQAVRSPVGLTWYQARAAAVAMSHAGYPGHLVTITSAAEQLFLERHLPVSQELYWWIGAIQDPSAPDYREPNGGWRWVTGEPFVYGNWYPNEPNNHGSGENALEFDAKLGNLWNDFPDHRPLTGYLVEYEPLSPHAGTAPVQVFLPPHPVVGGQTATGQVQLPSLAGPGGVVVYLRSSNPAAAAVPATVTVPPGATGTTFPIVTFPVASPTHVGISAPGPGGEPVATLLVLPYYASPVGNLLVNGSFEDPKGSPHGFRNLPGWRMPRGTVDILQEPGWQAAPGQGQQMLDLVGTPGAATIEQSFPTEPGREYVFSGWISHNPEVLEGRANVYLNRQFFVHLYHREPGVIHRDMRWVPFAYRFRASEHVTTLTLEDVTNLWDAGGGIFLDGLAVAPVAGPHLPEAQGAPTGLTAQAVSVGQVNLSWIDNSHGEEGFAIFRRESGHDWTRIAVVGPNVTRFADLDVRVGRTYQYRVQAVGPAGTSGWSHEAQVTVPGDFPPPVTTPAPPSDLTAARIEATRVELRWQDNSDNEQEFILWRRQGSGEFIRIGHVGRNVTHFTDTGLQPRTAYTYVVRSWNPQGGPSRRSNELTITTPALPPVSLNPPSAVSATAVSATQIRLTWVDDVVGEAVFVVYRKGSGSADFVKIADVPANGTTFLDQGLTPGTTYSYLVRAWHPERGVSRRSNEASATTPLAQ